MAIAIVIIHQEETETLNLSVYDKFQFKWIKSINWSLSNHYSYSKLGDLNFDVKKSHVTINYGSDDFKSKPFKFEYHTKGDTPVTPNLISTKSKTRN